LIYEISRDTEFSMKKCFVIFEYSLLLEEKGDIFRIFRSFEQKHTKKYLTKFILAKFCRTVWLQNNINATDIF
jgi:hypothetical protein